MNSKRVIGSHKTMTAKVGPDDLDYDINRVEFRSHFIQRNFLLYIMNFLLRKGKVFFDNTGGDGRIKNNYKKKKKSIMTRLPSFSSFICFSFSRQSSYWQGLPTPRLRAAGMVALRIWLPNLRVADVCPRPFGRPGLVTQVARPF